MIQHHTHAEIDELADELLEGISGGLDIDDDHDLDTSWWDERLGFPPLCS